jgi:hypothetical protein
MLGLLLLGPLNGNHPRGLRLGHGVIGPLPSIVSVFLRPCDGQSEAYCKKSYSGDTSALHWHVINPLLVTRLINPFLCPGIGEGLNSRS